jgi:hypothetical protein
VISGKREGKEKDTEGRRGWKSTICIPKKIAY